MVSSIFVGFQLMSFFAEFAELQDVAYIDFHVPVTFKNSMGKFWKSWIRIQNSRPIHISFHSNGANVSMDYSGPASLAIFVPDPANLEHSIKQFQHLMDQSLAVDNVNVNWLLDLNSTGSRNRILEYLKNSSLAFDSNVYGFKNNDTDNIDIEEFYRIGPPGLTIHHNHLTTWNISSGILNPPEDMWIRRSDLMGLQLRSQSLPYYQHVRDMELLPDGSYTVNGIYPDIFYALQEILNFTSVLSKPPDGKWGGKNPDGSWNGMVSQLMMNKSDIIVAPLDITFVRSEVIDYTAAIDSTFKQLFVKNPSDSYNVKAYFEPMHYLSWLAVVLFCLFTPPVLWLSARFPMPDANQGEFSRGKSFVFILSSLTMRGWSVEPRSIHSKIVFLCLMVSSMLIYYHWEAMLISFLTSKELVLPFRNYAELLQTNYRIFVMPGTANEEYYKSSTDPIMKVIWKERIEPYLQSYHESKWKGDQAILKDESLAFHVAQSGALASQAYQNCEIVAIPERGQQASMAFALQKGSPYTKVLTYYINQMREKGSLKKIIDKYKAGPQICQDNSGKALGLTSCFTAFIPLAFGITIGLICISIEAAIKKTNLKTDICLYNGKTKTSEADEGKSKDELLDTIGQLRTEKKDLADKLSKYKSILEKLGYPNI